MECHRVLAIVSAAHFKLNLTEDHLTKALGEASANDLPMLRLLVAKDWALLLKQDTGVRHMNRYMYIQYVFICVRYSLYLPHFLSLSLCLVTPFSLFTYTIHILTLYLESCVHITLNFTLC